MVGQEPCLPNRLTADGRKTPAGLAHVEAARVDRRWETAYEGFADVAVPQDFLHALEARPEAEAILRPLNRKNLYPIYYRLQTAKRPETRTRRIQQILDQLRRDDP